jgi:hypothetical protein
MEPQGHSQLEGHFAHTNQSYGRGSTRVRAQPYPWPYPPPFDFTQPATPHHNLQSRTQGTFQDTISMQPRGSNDAYRGSSVNGFSRFPTDPLGTGAYPPWRSGEDIPQYFPYGHFAQGGSTHTGFPVITEQIPDNAMNFPHSLPGTSTRQSNQRETPVWQLSNLNWVNHEAQGELHLTIVFRKVPFA